MKHLKGYKIFESTETRSIVRDILRDCEDFGLLISVDESPKGYFVQISCVGKVTVQVQFKDILSNVEHLINYMNDIGYSNFNYVDTLSEFNIYYEMQFDDWSGEDVRVASKGRVNNILPPDDDTRSSWIGIGKMMFTK